MVFYQAFYPCHLDFGLIPSITWIWVTHINNFPAIYVITYVVTAEKTYQNGGCNMQTMVAQIKNYPEVGEYEKQLFVDTLKAYRIDLQRFAN